MDAVPNVGLDQYAMSVFLRGPRQRPPRSYGGSLVSRAAGRSDSGQVAGQGMFRSNGLYPGFIPSTHAFPGAETLV